MSELYTSCQREPFARRQNNPAERAAAQQLWMSLLPTVSNHQELVVAYYTFVLGMSPQQIIAALPDCFENLSEVISIKLHLLNRLSHCLPPSHPPILTWP